MSVFGLFIRSFVLFHFQKLTVTHLTGFTCLFFFFWGGGGGGGGGVLWSFTVKIQFSYCFFTVYFFPMISVTTTKKHLFKVTGESKSI